MIGEERKEIENMLIAKDESDKQKHLEEQAELKRTEQQRLEDEEKQKQDEIQARESEEISFREKMKADFMKANKFATEADFKRLYPALRDTVMIENLWARRKK